MIVERLFEHVSKTERYSAAVGRLRFKHVSKTERCLAAIE
jgi:hypothetical protein